MRQTKLDEIDHRTAAKIDDKRNTGLFRQGCEIFFIGSGAEALDAEIAGVNF